MKFLRCRQAKSICQFFRSKSGLKVSAVFGILILIYINAQMRLVENIKRRKPRLSLIPFKFVNSSQDTTFHKLAKYRADHREDNKASRKLPSFTIQESTGALTYMNIAPILQEQIRRRKLLLDGCHGNKNRLFGLSSTKWAYDRITIHPESNLMYCPVLKIGSTFWRRVFYAIEHHVPIHTPYEIPIQTALQTKYKNLYSEMNKNESSTKNLLENSLKVMFVREPFARLLSGYIDKLFAPNPYFWSVIGRYIIKNFRVNASEKSKKCGHDVTFSEFVKYVIYTEEFNKPQRDAHFTPTYDQCKPCEIKYNVIGKMESFLNDTTFLMSNIGFNVSKQLLKEWAVNAEEDAINDSTRSPFGWKSGIKKCMSMYEAAQRIWRKIQIRGIVDIKEILPFSVNNIDKVSSSTFITALIDAKNRSKHNKKQQKLDAITDAFSQVSIEDKLLFRKLFLPDFELYDYDSKPSHIFNTNVDHKTFKTKYLDFRNNHF